MMLTGHLAENELRRAELHRAGLMEKARVLRAGKRPRRCRRASWRGGSRPMGSRCHSRTSAVRDAVHYLLPAIPIAAVRRARSASGGTVSRCCARPANAPGSGVPWGATCRWTSLRCSRTCWRSSTRSPTTSHRSGCRDELVGQMAEPLGADYDTLSLEIDDSESGSAH